MNKYKLKSEANSSLVVVRDNKPKWYLPESRRAGYRNLHKINRYGPVSYTHLRAHET